MRFIDFHCHVYPEAIGRKATFSTCDFYDLLSPFTGSPEEKKRVDEFAGIEKSLILPVAVVPRLVHNLNVYASGIQKNDPHFVAFGTVHAGDENTLSEVEGFKELGLHGIKMHPDMQKFDIDDERLLPLYDVVQGKLPVMFHSGDYRTQYSRPYRIRHLRQPVLPHGRDLHRAHHPELCPVRGRQRHFLDHLLLRLHRVHAELSLHVPRGGEAEILRRYKGEDSL